MTALQLLRDELLKQGIDVDGHETHSTQLPEDSKTENSVKDEVIKTISAKLKQHNEGQLITPGLGKEDQQKFAQLYTQVSNLVSDAKFVVVSKIL